MNTLKRRKLLKNGKGSKLLNLSTNNSHFYLSVFYTIINPWACKQFDLGLL